MMNAFERVKKVMAGQTPDRPPLYDLLRNDAAISYYAGEKLSPENRDWLVYKAIGMTLDSTKQFIRLPEEPRSEILPDGRKKIQERWTYWIPPYSFDTVAQAAEHLKTILDQAEEFIGDPKEYVRKAEADYLEKIESIGVNIALFLDIGANEGFQACYGDFGIEMFSYLSLDYPDLIGKFLDLYVQRSTLWIEHLTISNMLPGVFYGVDIAHKTGTIFSPKFLRKIVFPRMERLIQLYRSKQIPVLFHSDGNLWAVLDDLVALGIEALNPIEVVAGMDLAELRKKYPDLILVGGIDCSQLLPFATPEEVSREVTRAIQVAGPGYMPGSSTEIHNDIPLENVSAMFETAKGYQY